jgi:hypothetical protein
VSELPEKYLGTIIEYLSIGSCLLHSRVATWNQILLNNLNRLVLGKGLDMGQALNNLKFIFSTTRMLLFAPLEQHRSFELAWYSIMLRLFSIL